jgi:hypothetical protein
MMRLNKKIVDQYVRCPSCGECHYHESGHELNRFLKVHHEKCDVSSFEITQYIDIDPEHSAY